MVFEMVRGVTWRLQSAYMYVSDCKKHSSTSRSSASCGGQQQQQQQQLVWRQVDGAFDGRGTLLLSEGKAATGLMTDS
jgi:hypothetical protein